jgi:DNA-binding IclR family transcriptional regulator
MPRPRTDTAPAVPQVLEKALRVLESFDALTPEWSEVELRRSLGIPSTTLNRILRALEGSGYLLRDDAGRYRLGVAAVRLGRCAAASIDLPAAIDPELRGLARATDELIILAVPELEKGTARYVSTIDSAKRLRVTAEPGASVPLTAGGTARAVLAFQSPLDVDAVMTRPRRQLAPGTLLDAGRIRDELARTRASGTAMSWEETYEGAWAIGAPLVDAAGQAFAAIGVAIPTVRHTPELEAEIRTLVTATATAAAARLQARR